MSKLLEIESEYKVRQEIFQNFLPQKYLTTTLMSMDSIRGKKGQ
jgi:hypothetical protein